MTKQLLIIFVALSLYSCNREDTDDSIEIYEEEPVSGQVVALDIEIVKIRDKAVDTLTIGSNSFVLSAELYRDFMPSCPQNGKLMASYNWLVDIDSVKIPDNINMVKQYVILRDSICWIANYQGQSVQNCWLDYKMQAVSFSGPKWGPKISVEVISQICDLQTYQNYYIKQKDAYIYMTE